MNVQIVWFDREFAPVFERTEEPADGAEIHPTLTAAKAYALMQARDSYDRIRAIMRDIRATRRADVR